MWIDESFLWLMRTRIRTVLPPRTFLKRDRGEGLYITNAVGLPPIPGFILEKQGGLTRIMPDGEWVARVEKTAAQPPNPFCESMLRFHGQEISRENLLIFVLGAKLLDAGSAATDAEIAAFDRMLRQQAALALRGACTGGALYASALLNAQIHKNNHIKGEEDP